MRPARLLPFAPPCWALPSLALLLSACARAEAPKAPEGPRLVLPVACRIGDTCEVQTYVDKDASVGVQDYMCGERTNEGHDGVDIRVLDLAAQARGVDVLAGADGRVARLRDGMADVSIAAPDAPLVAGQECGNGVVIDHGDGWETQYCHLARGSVRVKVGEQVRAGQPIARVGLSGQTEFPHLHLAVRHDGVAVDPFSPDPYAEACQPQPGLWTAEAARQLAYKTGAVLNTGFAAAPVDMAAVEGGAVGAPGPDAPVLAAYVRAINLEGGDVQELTLRGPDGAILATSTLPPLDRAKAQYMMFVGKKRPPEGWPGGVYVASYRVLRNGQAALSRSWRLEWPGDPGQSLSKAEIQSSQKR